MMGFMAGWTHLADYTAAYPVTTVEALYLYPEARGTGAYKKLFEQMKEATDARGSKEVEFKSMYDPRIMKFYDKLGYMPVQVVYRKKEA